MGHKGQQEALRMSSEIQNYTNMYVNKLICKLRNYLWSKIYIKVQTTLRKGRNDFVRLTSVQMMSKQSVQGISLF